MISAVSQSRSGGVEFDFDYRAIAVGETLDPTTAQESVNVNDTAPATAHDRLTAEITLTDANFQIPQNLHSSVVSENFRVCRFSLLNRS